mgnify:CR=1 FL=1
MSTQLPTWYLRWAETLLALRNAQTIDIADGKQSELRGYGCALYMADLIKGDEYSRLMQATTSALNYALHDLILTKTPQRKA